MGRRQGRAVDDEELTGRATRSRVARLATVLVAIRSLTLPSHARVAKRLGEPRGENQHGQGGLQGKSSVKHEPLRVIDGGSSSKLRVP